MDGGPRHTESVESTAVARGDGRRAVDTTCPPAMAHPMTPGTRRPVRGVFFDVGDTLVHHAESMPAVLAREAASVGITIEGERLTAVESMTRARLAERTANGPPFSFPPGESRRFWTSLYVAALGEHLSVASSFEIAERAYAHFSSPRAYAVYPDVLPALRQLRALGIRLGIISNWESWLGQLIAHHDLDRWFDWVIASGDAEVEKPNPRIFDIALEQSGFVVDEVLYVGDSPTADIAGAQGAGWRAILLERGSHAGDPTGAMATIPGLSVLPALVSALDRP